MISMATGVIFLLTTSQTPTVSIFLIFLALSLLGFLLWVMTTYSFGTSLITHAANLAVQHVSHDIEAAKHGVKAVESAAVGSPRSAHSLVSAHSPLSPKSPKSNSPESGRKKAEGSSKAP